MIKTTTWALNKPNFNSSDIEWCSKLGVHVDISQLTNDVYISGTLMHKTHQGFKIRLKSFNKKQENFLKIKYGNTICPIEVVHD